MSAQTSSSTSDKSENASTASELKVEMLVCGNQGVGKTCILYRFQDPTREFQTSFLSTYGIDYKFKSIDVFDEEEQKMVTCKCRIWDTAGQERYVPIAVNRFRAMHGIILVYDITDAKTFYSVESWMKQIKDNTDSNTDYPVQILLVGNKADCHDKRVISTSQGEELAKKFNVPFFETSAKTLHNLNKIFETMCANSLPKAKYEQKKQNEHAIIKIVEKPMPRKKWKCTIL